MSEPKRLTSDEHRHQARYIRDRQWRFMERANEHDPLWFCVWNKNRLPEGPDEWRDGLISGMEICEWIRRHKDWFVIGEWDDGRYAFPVQLTEAGRQALTERANDMEPVYGGLVEPGWQAIPWPRSAPAAP
jgi:hypothetical protein